MNLYKNIEKYFLMKMINLFYLNKIKLYLYFTNNLNDISLTLES